MKYQEIFTADRSAVTRISARTVGIVIAIKEKWMPIEKSQELYHWWVQGNFIEASSQIKIVIVISTKQKTTIKVVSDFVVAATAAVII